MRVSDEGKNGSDDEKHFPAVDGLDFRDEKNASTGSLPIRNQKSSLKNHQFDPQSLD